MAGTTPRGYQFSEYGDTQNFPANIQTLAEDIDADVQALDDEVTDSLNRPSCTLTETGVQSVPTGVTTLLSFTNINYDNDGMAALPNGIDLIDDGIYLIMARITADVTGGTPAAFSVECRVTSSLGFIPVPVQQTQTATNTASEPLAINVAALHYTNGAGPDNIRVSVLHNAGVNVDFGARDFSCTKVSNLLTGS